MRRKKTPNDVVDQPRVEIPSVYVSPELKPLLVDISDVRLHDQNIRKDHSVTAIAESLQEFGWDQAIVALRSNGKVLKGNGRLKAAQSLGLRQVPVIWVDDDDKKSIRRMVADNRTGELSSWDFEALQACEAEIGDMTSLKLEELVPTLLLAQCDATEDDLSENNPRLNGFLERKAKSVKQGIDKTETHFLLCLTFQSFDQKMEFLRSFPEIQTKYAVYLDGEYFAGLIGHPVTPCPEGNITSPMNTELADLALGFEE